MPDYNFTIRKRLVNVMYPVGPVGPGDNERIRRKIGGAVERGEKSGEFKFRPRIPDGVLGVIKWKVVTQKPGRKRRQTH